MKLLGLITTLLLVDLTTASISYSVDGLFEFKDDRVIVVTKELFRNRRILYTGEHEVVDMLYPINALNTCGRLDETESLNSNGSIFFVLADTVNGKRVDKGLYIRKEGVVTKLLENGRASAAANDFSNVVYFGAKDGLYRYNAVLNKAEKYGNITDSIIGIAKATGSEIIYILTEDHLVYKVTKKGTMKELFNYEDNVQQIALDYANNLYYYTSDMKIYLLNSHGFYRIACLPRHIYHIKILKPPFNVLYGVYVIVNNKSYILYDNGKLEPTNFEFKVMPSAFSLEGTLIQYYAYDKKIYEVKV